MLFPPRPIPILAAFTGPTLRNGRATVDASPANAAGNFIAAPRPAR